MPATIDVDIGGTFTDCFVMSNGRMVRGKAPTTKHNLSIGFKQAVEDCADQLGLARDELLKDTTVIRYSTTQATNSLIERTGPRLGLITTKGHEEAILIGRARQWADGLHLQERRHMYRASRPEPLIPYDMIAGVSERVDCFGQVIIPAHKEDIRRQVRYLVDKGASGIVVSFLWSFLNPAHEKMVREVIAEEFPNYYLGSLPVYLSSEVQPKWHEYPRTMVTILCAYLHGGMTEQMSTLTNELRERGFSRTLFLVNSQGGMAKVTRTRAVDTYNAGPVAGVFGGAYISKMYGFPKVVLTDMGGTSFDYALLLDGTPNYYQEWPVIDRWATETSMVEVNGIGAGGGSIAWINKLFGDRLEVGPKSAGANPGPACYGAGGVEPTVTDADLILGYVNPDYFLGGRMKLDKEKAIKAMERISKPLGLTVDEAARNVRKVVAANMGNVIFKEISLKGFGPKEFVVFAYGGAGPTHCADYAAYLGAPKIITFPFSAVFCALGGATMDLKHIYETSRNLNLCTPGRPGRYTTDFAKFNSVVDSLAEKALRDMENEGFSAKDVEFRLELEMKYGRQGVFTRFVSPKLRLESEADVAAICEAFYQAYIKRYGTMSALPEMGINVDNFYLVATVYLPNPQIATFDLAGENPKAALKGKRSAYWESLDGFKETPVFDGDLLKPGNLIPGPAIVESKDTTIVIPPDRKLTIDKYLNGIMECI